MKTLLKDMPEHMERIENNFILQDKIKDCLIENQIVVFETNSENSECNYALHSNEFKSTSEAILKELTEFVNQNYLFKGNLSTKITGILTTSLNDFDDAICPDGERHDIAAIMDNKIDGIVEAILA